MVHQPVMAKKDRPQFTLKLLHPKYWLTGIGFSLWWLLIQILPFSAHMFLGKLLGLLLLKANISRCRIARRNIELCFPELNEQERQALLRKQMISVARGLFDTAISWFWPYWRLKRVIDVNGLEHLVKAQENNQGILFIGMHFTSLEISGAGVNRSLPEMPFNGVYRPHDNALFDYIQRNGRERHCMDLKVVPKADVRGMIKALRQGRVMAYLPDQDYGRKHSIFVPFFGIEAATVTAASQLVKMGRAKILAYRAVRKPDASGYIVDVFPEIEGYGQGDEVDDAKILNDFIEARVREYPDQYFWVHRRFKTRPEGEKGVY